MAIGFVYGIGAHVPHCPYEWSDYVAIGLYCESRVEQPTALQVRPRWKVRDLAPCPKGGALIESLPRLPWLVTISMSYLFL